MDKKGLQRCPVWIDTPLILFQVLRENEYGVECSYPPAILQVHLLFKKPNPVFRLQLLPLQYWQTELHLKGVAVHWPLRHVSARVHAFPSSHATPSRLDQVLILLPGLHH